MVSTDLLHYRINKCAYIKSVSLKLTHKEKIMLNSIKAIISTVWEILCATGEAKYAAELARNQKWADAQALYKK
jgi:hypothetical protein